MELEYKTQCLFRYVLYPSVHNTEHIYVRCHLRFIGTYSFNNTIYSLLVSRTMSLPVEVIDSPKYNVLTIQCST